MITINYSVLPHMEPYIILEVCVALNWFFFFFFFFFFYKNIYCTVPVVYTVKIQIQCTVYTVYLKSKILCIQASIVSTANNILLFSRGASPLAIFRTNYNHLIFNHCVEFR